MIEVFKIVHGYYNNINNIYLLPHVDVATGVINTPFKLYQSSVKYDLRKHLFTNNWCNLPDGVLGSDIINCFTI